jgi:hypothetical protein
MEAILCIISAASLFWFAVAVFFFRQNKANNSNPNSPKAFKQ